VEIADSYVVVTEEIVRPITKVVDKKSEPGFINMEAAQKRAPWCHGINPCAEILLGNKGFCNLVDIDVAKFTGDSDGLHRTLYIMARANYRQTLVHLKDGILQEAWHLNNEFLRLCGVGLTGVARRPDLVAYDYRNMERIATAAAYSMADELGTQRPKNVTTIKPSGTLSKIFDTTEGAHMPLGRCVFNNVMFSEDDESIPSLRAAGYKIVPHPYSPRSVLVTFPVRWDSVPFTTVNGVELNLESAITQLERYALLQNNWTQQNTSVTISYSPDEVPSIIDWLLDHWDLYVGVSFLYRTDPSKTAADLGYAYLPQEVVTKHVYDEYVATLSPLTDIRGSFVEIESQECAGGRCPIK
jgi:ribonucleoside-triphosphate reductase